MLASFDLISRARAAGIHLLISAAIAALAAALVFGLWFPGAYRFISGGRELFWLITCVDVVLGPLLTFTVFNSTKSKVHLIRDLTVIGGVQVAALVYGLVTVYGARPVALVFEVDRFRVITAVMVHEPELSKARPEYRQLPLNGPWILGTRVPAGDERNDALFMAIQHGIDWGQRPQFWQPYADSVAAALARARPLNVLLNRYPEKAGPIEATLRAKQIDPASTRYLPLIGRSGDWIVILNSNGHPVHFAPLDGFF